MRSRCQIYSVTDRPFYFNKVRRQDHPPTAQLPIADLFANIIIMSLSMIRCSGTTGSRCGPATWTCSATSSSSSPPSCWGSSCQPSSTRATCLPSRSTCIVSSGKCPTRYTSQESAEVIPHSSGEIFMYLLFSRPTSHIRLFSFCRGK